jgi:endogenous inhibitor of DNA gyrase (YacG/DUF329 family)
MRCPICKKPVDEDEPGRPRWFPFCSERCKLIDLGRWLGEKYQVPVDDPDKYLPPPAESERPENRPSN